MPDIEKVRDRILLSNDRVWGITSVESGVGKTYISKLLLESLEEVGKKVLYLSLGNMQQGDSMTALEDELGTVKDAGKSKYVALINPSHRAKIVYGKAFEELVQIYKEQYDYIIVDMTSIKEDSVVEKICTVCDETIILISKDSEDGFKVGRAIKQLLKSNIKIAGIVMNEYKTKRALIRI